MKAIILAGGRGKRLKPVTDYVPKPLVPIKNIPIIEWQIRYLKKFGIKEIIICTGYKTEMIENHLNMKDIGIKIKFSIEKTPLGTGGDIDLKKLQKKKNAIAAIELRTKYGILETEDDKILNFKEKKEISDTWMNAGIYHLEKTVLRELPDKGDIEKTVFPNSKICKKRNSKHCQIQKYKMVFCRFIQRYGRMRIRNRENNKIDF
jgi:NDP-sugar pyrophosphorylase family protein